MSEDNNELKAPQEQQPVEYTDDNIRHLSDMEHVRTAHPHWSPALPGFHPTQCRTSDTKESSRQREAHWLPWHDTLEEYR